MFFIAGVALMVAASLAAIAIAHVACKSRDKQRDVNRTLWSRNLDLSRENAALKRDNLELLGKAQERGVGGRFVSKK